MSKSSAFKMKGFSYAGQSPMKGKKKQAQLAAAATKKETAMSEVEDFKLEGESTNLLEGTNTVYGQMPSAPGGPLPKRAPLREGTTSMPTLGAQQLDVNWSDNIQTPSGEAPVSTPKKSFGGAMGAELGATVGKALIEGAVALGVNALSNKKKKPTRKTGVADTFSQVKIGRA